MEEVDVVAAATAAVAPLLEEEEPAATVSSPAVPLLGPPPLSVPVLVVGALSMDASPVGDEASWAIPAASASVDADFVLCSRFTSGFHITTLFAVDFDRTKFPTHRTQST